MTPGPGAARQCKHCGAHKEQVGRAKKYWICRACNRQRARERGTIAAASSSVDLTGANDRLARFLDDHWDAAVDRLADLVVRNSGYGKARATGR